MSTLSPFMHLPISAIGVDSGLAWETNLNASLSILDSHNHSSGQGQQIQPNGLNINADLTFQNNNAINLRTTRFAPQASPIANTGSDVGELYVSGNELYYNDVTGGNQVQLTSNGTVNATSSGISSGTASAAFAAGVLVVKSTATSGGNVLMQSAVLTNSGNLTNQLTLQAPTLSANSTLTFPAIPGAASFMQIDTSGNMSATIPISGGITGSMIAAATVTNANLAAVGQQVSLSSGVASTGSTTPVNITNLSVTITTTGRPVMVGLIPDTSGNESSIGANLGSGASADGLINYSRGATVIAQIQLLVGFAGSSQVSTIRVPPPGFILDVVGAGTYTYTIQAYVPSPGSTALVTNCVLVAYEL
jgi:hypothetical protein